MSDIRERIKKLIGPGPSFTTPTNSLHIDATWYQWHLNLIDQLTEKAKLIYSSNNQPLIWSTVMSEPNAKFDDYSALMLDIQPIRKGVTKSEIVSMLKGGCGASTCFESSEARMLADRIESEGIIND